MATIVKLRSISILKRASCLTRPLISSAVIRHNSDNSHEPVTHTGQQYAIEDYRRMRFTDREKLVNEQFAIKLVDEEPVVVCEQRTVFSDGGGALGHPRVFINLDKPEVSVCGYSGRKFIYKKYYNKAEHGPSITYEEYVKEMNPQETEWPN